MPPKLIRKLRNEVLRQSHSLAADVESLPSADSPNCKRRKTRTALATPQQRVSTAEKKQVGCWTSGVTFVSSRHTRNGCALSRQTFCRLAVRTFAGRSVSIAALAHRPIEGETAAFAGNGCDRHTFSQPMRGLILAVRDCRLSNGQTGALILAVLKVLSAEAPRCHGFLRLGRISGHPMTGKVAP